MAIAKQNKSDTTLVSYTLISSVLAWALSLRYGKPGRVAQSVGHLTRKSGSWVRYPVWQHTFVSPSAFSRRAVVSYWRKYVHEVLVNRLGGLSLPRKSVVRLTDRPDMTLDVYRGRKTTMQQQQLRYGSQEEILNFYWYLIRFDSFSYKGGIHMSAVYYSFTVSD